MSQVQGFRRPSFAFIAASWCALLVGVMAYLIGLWSADMQLNEKGYYFAVLVLTLFAAVSLQKSVRDRLEGTPVTGLYYGVTWAALLTGIVLLCIGLFNASFTLSEKGFYGMSFALSAFAAIAVQKNTRDLDGAKPDAALDVSVNARERDSCPS